VSDPLRFDEVPADEPPAGDDPARVIVKVRRPGYVPDGFRVRTRIDDILFTAEALESDVAAAQADPDVVSVERGRPLRMP